MTIQVSLSPVFNDAQFFDNNGAVLNGGKLFTYEAGSNSAELPTYADSTGTSQNPNPIVLDSAGRIPTELWLVNGSTYNLVLTQPDGTTVLRALDNIKGSMPANIPGAGSNLIWNVIDATPVYLAGTLFYVDGDYGTELQIGNRIQYQFNDDTFGYGTINNCQVTADPLRTVVTFTADNFAFNNNVTAVYWSVATSTNQIVDAGGVTLDPNITYTGATVGTNLQLLLKIIQSGNLTYDTGGTAPNYTVTPYYQYASINEAQVNVKFHQSSFGAAATFKLGTLPSAPLKQYDSSGALVNPMIAAGQVARIGNDGSNFIVLTPLPTVPAGTVVFFAANDVPEGYLLCNGATYTATQYPTLAALLGDPFTVPDLRGRFVRGFDDGAGNDPGRTFGSYQADAFKEHNHRMVWTWYDGGAGRGLVDPVNPVDITYAGQTGGNASWGVTFAGDGNLETRPKNVALLPCIKY